MKSLWTVLLAVSTLAGTAMAAPQTYALKCRPGDKTSMNISVTGDLRFGFAKAPRAAGANGAGLQKGECAWQDRAIGASEPGTVAVALNSAFKVGAVIPHVSNNSFKAYAYAQNQGWVYEFMTKDTILTIYAYNDGQYLRVPNP